MVFVTHPIEEVLPVFSRSLLIRRGRIFEQGATREVLTAEKLSAFFETGAGSSGGTIAQGFPFRNPKTRLK